MAKEEIMNKLMMLVALVLVTFAVDANAQFNLAWAGQRGVVAVSLPMGYAPVMAAPMPMPMPMSVYGRNPYGGYGYPGVQVYGTQYVPAPVMAAPMPMPVYQQPPVQVVVQQPMQYVERSTYEAARSPFRCMPSTTGGWIYTSTEIECREVATRAAQSSASANVNVH